MKCLLLFLSLAAAYAEGQSVNADLQPLESLWSSTSYGKESTPYGKQLTPHGKELTPHGKELTPHGKELTSHGKEGYDDKEGYASVYPQEKPAMDKPYINFYDYPYKIIGRFGLGFQKRTSRGSGLMEPITPEALELIGKRDPHEGYYN